MESYFTSKKKFINIRIYFYIFISISIHLYYIYIYRLHLYLYLYMYLFVRNLLNGLKLVDKQLLKKVSFYTFDKNPIFLIFCWIPYKVVLFRIFKYQILFSFFNPKVYAQNIYLVWLLGPEMEYDNLAPPH